MPQKIAWTTAQDTRIKRMRGEGATWDAIAAALRVSRHAMIEHGRRIGARPPPRETKPPPEDPDRPPFPPGHPRTWQILIDGTVLEGSDYPLPVFLT